MYEKETQLMTVYGEDADFMANPIKEIAKRTTFRTPMIEEDTFLSDAEKIEFIAERFREIMIALGLDLNDSSLMETPHRVAKMYVKDLFCGLDEKNFPQILFLEDKYKHNEVGNMVFIKTYFTSVCEHHFVPFTGTAYVAYIPNQKIIGLSKIPRIVRFFSKRPQIQERLTAQIADSLTHILETENVAVSMTAEHQCMIMRGVEDCCSHTITNVLKGRFDRDPNTRREFFDAINREAK